MIWTLAQKEGNANSCATAKNSNIMYNISVVVVLLCVLYEVCNICTGIHNESFLRHYIFDIKLQFVMLDIFQNNI